MASLNSGIYENWSVGIPMGQLAYLIVKREFDDGQVRVDHLHNPTADDIKRVCVEYDLPTELVLDNIRKAGPDIYGFVIDRNKYLEYLQNSNEPEDLAARLTVIERHLGINYN